MYKVFINDQAIIFSSEEPAFQGKDVLVLNEILEWNPLKLVEKASSGKSVVLISPDPEKNLKAFIKEFQLIKAAGGVVRKDNSAGPFLMIFRIGKWDLPKGKIDKGENKEQAAIREVEEECGVTGLNIIKPLPDTFHLYKVRGTWLLKQTFWYEMICSGGNELKPQREENIQEVRWMNEKELMFILPLCFSSIRNLLENYLIKT